jgi:hypothetical protein
LWNIEKKTFVRFSLDLFYTFESPTDKASDEKSKKPNLNEPSMGIQLAIERSAAQPL